MGLFIFVTFYSDIFIFNYSNIGDINKWQILVY